MSSIVIELVLIHNFNLYIIPNSKDILEQIIKNFKEGIDSLLSLVSNANIIICGDFNQRRVDIETFCINKGRYLILKNGTQTNKNVNHFDKVYSNLFFSEISSEEFNFTNHSGIKIKFNFKKTQQNLELRALRNCLKETIKTKGHKFLQQLKKF